MVDPRDGEHANYVESQTHDYCYPTNADPQGREAGDVNSPEYALLKDIHERKVLFRGVNVTVVHGHP